MIRKGLLYALMAGSLLYASCDGDLGNYSYRDLTAPTVTGIEQQMNVRKYDRLVLEPQIGGENYTEERYDFEWKAVLEDDAEEAIVLGNERVLDCEMNLPEGSYNLYFIMTDRESGVFWQQTYTLWVTQTTSEGWMVLCNDGGKTRLDMVSMVTGQTYRDLLANQKEMPVLNGPRRIYQLEDFAEEGSPFYLLTDDGATRLANDAFAWTEEYNIRYEMANGQPVTPHEIVTTVGGKMMVAGTDFYYASCSPMLDLFGLPVNEGFRVAPMAGSNVAASMMIAPLVMMYDIDNNRFVGYGRLLEGTDLGKQDPVREMNEMASLMDEMKETTGGVTGTAFDEFPTGLEYVYMENTRYDPGNGQMGITYTVLADGDQRYLYGIQLGDMVPQSWSSCPVALGKAYYGELSGCTDITKVTDLFAFSSLKNCMYYAVDRTVYRVDLSTIPLRAERHFTLPTGETITRMKFNLYRKTANRGRSYDLVVGSLRGEEGILRIYPDNDLEGDFSKVTPEKYEGFARIVDVTYREW